MDWKKIEDYDYSINENGEIRNNLTGYILKNYTDIHGYYYTMLYKNRKGKTFRIHRLLAKYFLPDFQEELQVDHKDRDKTNNNLNNLRIVTHRENLCNQAKHKKCSSKYKGVTFDKNRNKFQASITINYKAIFLGRYKTEEEAAEAYNKYIDDNNLEYYPKNIF